MHKIYSRQTNFPALNLDKIMLNKNNHYNMNGIEELANHISQHGLLKPFIVAKLEDNEDGYEYRMISGERRYRALKVLNEMYAESGNVENNLYQNAPCIVLYNLSEIDEQILFIEENAQVNTISDIDKLRMIKFLEDEYKTRRNNGERFAGLKIKDLIARDLRMSVSTVARLIKINNNLIEPLSQKISTGYLSMANIAKISSLPREQQEKKNAELEQDMEFWAPNIVYVLKTFGDEMALRRIYNFYKENLPTPSYATEYIRMAYYNITKYVTYESGEIGTLSCDIVTMKFTVDVVKNVNCTETKELELPYSIVEKYIRILIANSEYLPKNS
jgi:ParB-like chromosome segregation protein Spo0J